MRFNLSFKLLACFVLFLINKNGTAQKKFYGENPVNWEDFPAPALTPEISKYDNSDLVIINDEVEFAFYASDNEKITRNITIKINSVKGIDLLKTYKLPESFDHAYDAGYYKQGRLARVKTPFLREYTISKFSARKYSGDSLVVIPFTLKYEKIKWIRSSGDYAGEFMNEDLSLFQFDNLSVGEVIQFVYEAKFNSNYGNNLFYFHSTYPKLHCKYTFVYKVLKRFEGHSFVKPINISKDHMKNDRQLFRDYAIITNQLEFHDLQAVNYPANSFEGQTLPHLFADFRVYRKLTGNFPSSDGGRIYDFELYRPKDFEWLVFTDTSNSYIKVYDKQFTAIRKFASKMPPVGTDSLNRIFFKALCDTFNSFRYITSNHLFYNEAHLKEVYSGEHLLKRRLIESSQWKIYTDLLNDAKVFYFIVNVQDKRFGEHNPAYRASYAYETELIAIPSGDSYIYFMPRYNGMKYYLNELPFYFEGSLALLSPRNFQSGTKNKDEQLFKFIKTHRGTFNENTRAENVTARISLDSLKADLTIKESLSGQFSTILRHKYLNQYLDSTLSPLYFKKCTDKPFASNVAIKLSSKITDYPFRHNFNCTERIGLPGDQHLRLKNWFSFTLSKTSIPEAPTHDYYFDFDFSDTYNYMLNFTSPVELKNSADFAKKINNDFFTLESDVSSSSETSYLLRVKLIVKQRSIPKEKINLLMDVVKELDTLNDFSLELVRK